MSGTEAFKQVTRRAFKVIKPRQEYFLLRNTNHVYHAGKYDKLTMAYFYTMSGLGVACFSYALYSLTQQKNKL